MLTAISFSANNKLLQSCEHIVHSCVPFRAININQLFSFFQQKKNIKSIIEALTLSTEVTTEET